MFNLTSLIILALFQVQVFAQQGGNRAPWVRPYLSGGVGQQQQNRPMFGSPNFAGGSSQPALRPYMGQQFGQQFRRPPDYGSPYGYQNRPMRQAGFGNMFQGMLGGGNNGGGIGNLISGLISQLFGGSSAKAGSYEPYRPSYDTGNTGYRDTGYSPRGDFADNGNGSFDPADQVSSPIAGTGVIRQPPVAQTPPEVLPHDMGRTDPDAFDPADQGVTPGAPPNPRDGAVVTVPDQLNAAETEQIRARNRVNGAVRRAPVWGPFYRSFKACRPDCEPIGVSAYAHNRKSCHNTGRALDMFGMECKVNGRFVKHMAIQSSKTRGPIAELTNCMTGTAASGRGGNLRVNRQTGVGCLWHNGPGVTSGHRDHVHWSIGCGGMW